MRKRLSICLALVLLLSLSLTAMVSANANLPEKGPKVLLKDYVVKPGKAPQVPYGLMKKGYAINETGSYIIVFSGPITKPMRTRTVELGAQIEEYLPEFSYLALMTPGQARNIESLSFVENVMIYQPAYKINPSLKAKMNGNKKVTVNVVPFKNDVDALENVLNNAGAQKMAKGKGVAVVNVHPANLAKLANSNKVKYLEEKPTYQLLNDIAKGIMNVDDVWNLGYDGSTQVVGICDTGLDTGVNDSTMHPDFQGRIDAIYALGKATAEDTHGHGTHVAGSVLGDGTASNGQIQGMAPAAHMVFQSVLDSSGGLGGLPADLNTLYSQAWNAGARIHTNSWGAAVGGDYTTDCVNTDEYMWNNKDMTILFAAGNDGNPHGPRIVYESIGAPGTSKNVITVGASENDRPSKGSYADNINEIALFSSRGNTSDGRIKPDVSAPGTWILSTKSSAAPIDSYWGAYNDYYAYMGGTSMATPLTAGAVAIAREYMQTEWGITPKGSMLKAALINGATDMGHGVPSKDQGWGRVNLVDSLASKEYKYDNETVSLSTGEKMTYTYNVASSSTPLRLSMVWTDYPGSTSAKVQLVNDLDIKVTSPSGQVYHGNDFSKPYDNSVDRLNNVENVWIDSPEVGTYTIEVSAYNVPFGPQPYSLFASGDFQ